MHKLALIETAGMLISNAADAPPTAAVSMIERAEALLEMSRHSAKRATELWNVYRQDPKGFLAAAAEPEAVADPLIGFQAADTIAAPGLPVAAIFISGEVGLGETPDAILGSIDPAVELCLRISSLGGQTDCGLKWFELLRDRNAKAVIKIACSAATLIALGCSKRYIVRDGLMMVHSARGFAYGTPAQLHHRATKVEAVNAKLASLIASRTKVAIGTIEEWLASDKATWLTAEQCLDYGFAHEYAQYA